MGKRRSGLSTRYFHAALLPWIRSPAEGASPPAGQTHPAGEQQTPQHKCMHLCLGQTPQYGRMHPYLTKLQRVVSHLATVDQTEVCPLSRGVMSQPLSAPLQRSLRFLRHPLPAQSTAFLTVRLPAILRWRPYRLTTFPARHTTDLGSAYSPAVSGRRNPNLQRAIR